MVVIYEVGGDEIHIVSSCPEQGRSNVLIESILLSTFSTSTEWVRQRATVALFDSIHIGCSDVVFPIKTHKSNGFSSLCSTASSQVLSDLRFPAGWRVMDECLKTQVARILPFLPFFAKE